MSERLTNFKPDVDVLRFDHHALVLNLNAGNQRAVGYLAEELEYGPFDDWISAVSGGNSFVDDPEDPRFYAKFRYFSRKHAVQSALKHHPSGTFIRRVDNAANSLVNEIKIAEPVKTLLSDPRAIEIVQSKGFSGIGLVEPLVGVIDSESWRKYMVYEYLDARPIQPRYHFDADVVVDELSRLFLTEGIYPEDLDRRHLITSSAQGGRFLNLIDIERFHSKATSS